MDYFDALIRFAATGQLVLLALLAVLDRGRNLASVLLAVSAVSVAAILMNTSLFQLPIEARWILRVVETPNTALLWLLGLALFRDDFKIRIGHWCVVGLVCLQGIAIRFDVIDFNLPFRDERLIATYVTLFALLAHLVWRVVRDAREDLLARRRQARFWALIGFAALGATVAIFEMALPHAMQSLLRAGVVLILTTSLSVWLMRFDTHSFSFASEVDTGAQSITAPAAVSPLGRKLAQVIDVEQAYLEPNLTVKALADRIGFAEHRVRVHINRETGFRNFASFINHHRVEAAKAMLRDPERARGGILPIALDVGFASLTTFNRAFKSIEGMTPSQYRTSVLDDDGASH